MIDIKPQPVPAVVPPLLSFVAGFVDSATFLGLFGVFVAQMTGSFVLGGTQFVSAEHGLAIKLLAIPAFFIGGCVTTVIAAVAASRRGDALPWVLGLECLLLCGLLATVLAAAPFRSIDAPGVLLAALIGIGAMGVQSAMVRLLMSGVASTNVMTTNTTQLAIDVTWLCAGLCRGGEAATCKPVLAARERLAGLLPIALGFVAGTAVGAVAFHAMGFVSLVAPIAIASMLLVWAMASRGGRMTASA